MTLLLPLTGLLAGSETIAMTSITKYSKNGNKLFMLLAFIIYGFIIPFSVLKTLTFAGIGTVNFMWNIITTVSMIIIGHFYFGDKMSNLHLISLMLGIASITILYIAERL